MIVKEVKVKDYLSKSKLGDYAINPYVGCPHACKYCYASFMKRFTLHCESWGEFLDVRFCDKPIDLKKISGRNVFLSSVTDCYNHYEAKYEVTRKILEELSKSDAFIQIATKNKLITRDIDLLKKIKHLEVAISVNTLNENFRRAMDRASSIKDRLETLRTLHENGIKTILFMSPIFIGITDYRAIIEKTKDYVDEYWLEDLSLRGSFKRAILDFIKQNYSELYPLYEEIYLKNNMEKIKKFDAEIVTYCIERGIKYKAYFHHEEVMKNREKILGLPGDRFIQRSIFSKED